MGKIEREHTDGARRHVVWAKNLTELGANLEPTRGRPWLNALKKHPKCPGTRQNGHYHVGKWQTFVDEHGAKAAPKDQSEPASTARSESLALDNELKRLKLRQAQGEMIPIDEVVEVLAESFSEFAAGHAKLADEISTQLVGLETAGQVKKRLTPVLRELLRKFSEVKQPVTDDLKKKAFFKKLSELLSPHRRRLFPGDGPSGM